MVSAAPALSGLEMHFYFLAVISCMGRMSGINRSEVNKAVLKHDVHTCGNPPCYVLQNNHIPVNISGLSLIDM